MGVVLPARPDRVWEVLEDWEGQAAWMPDVAWIRVLSSERALGARLAVRTRVFGVPATTDLLRVTAWEPPRLLGIEHEGLVKGSAEWRLTERGEGTRFDWVEDLTMRPRWLGEIALRVYRPVLRWTFRRSMANLARIVAGGGGSPT